MVSNLNQTKTGDATKVSNFDVIVIGAGFAGLYALHRMRDQLGLTVRAYDTAGGVGGTWYWNRYPGARCDIESIHYSYSFSEELQQEWEWTERYASQPEILAYLNYVADRFDLRRDIQFNTRVASMVWDEETRQWQVGFDNGNTARARWVISAAGPLTAAPHVPEFAGMKKFSGEVYMTARWPHQDVDLNGKRVAVIGTGPSGIQVIQEVAKHAAYLTVFQRTADYATPLGNGPLDPSELASVKKRYSKIRKAARNHFLGIPPYDGPKPSALAVSPLERREVYDRCWNGGGYRLYVDSFQDIMFDKEANDTVAEYIRAKIRERVKDPKTAEMLSPRHHPYGTRRPPFESNYYEVFNQNNVELVDVRSTPIEEVTETGLRTRERSFEFDVLILATGFDAMSGPMMRIGVVGRDGKLLTEHWSRGPRTYLGIGIRHFPNLIMIAGPHCPLQNIPPLIEYQVDFATKMIRYMVDNDIVEMEPAAATEDEWQAHIDQIASEALYSLADSWYMGSNVKDKPRICMVYLGGGDRYRAFCDEIVKKGYDGFEFR